MSRQFADFEWRPFSAAGGWYGGILRAEFPVPDSVRHAWMRVATALIPGEPPDPLMVLIQFFRLLPGDDIRILQRNARLWQPEVGLGVWPDREPPSLWTREDFESADRPSDLRPLMYKVMKIADNPPARTSATESLLGRGALMRIGASPDEFRIAMNRALLPSIEHQSFNSFPFYVPLLEVKTLRNATEQQIDSWLPSASCYVRESSEDKGLLIFSREPFTHRLREARARQRQDDVWLIAPEGTQTDR